MHLLVFEARHTGNLPTWSAHATACAYGYFSVRDITCELESEKRLKAKYAPSKTHYADLGSKREADYDDADGQDGGDDVALCANKCDECTHSKLAILGVEP